MLRRRRAPLLSRLRWLLAVLVVVPIGSEASASHYSLQRIDMVTPAERMALLKVGIRDTRVLLYETATMSRRVWLSRVANIDLERLRLLATQCDLLRVADVGPSMVEALQLAGIRDTQALASATPKELLPRMRSATRGTPLRNQLPNAPILRAWIGRARALLPVLRDLPEVPQ